MDNGINLGKSRRSNVRIARAVGARRNASSDAPNALYKTSLNKTTTLYVCTNGCANHLASSSELSMIDPIIRDQTREIDLNRARMHGTCVCHPTIFQ